MLLALLCFAIFSLLVKGASTIWLVRRPNATTVLDTRHGQIIYYASKISVILFLAAMLARALLQNTPGVQPEIWGAGLIIAIIMAVKVIRKRIAGEWYGYAHELKERRRRRGL